MGSEREQLTLELLLGDLWIPAGLEEVVPHARRGREADCQRDSGSWLGHYVKRSLVKYIW